MKFFTVVIALVSLISSSLGNDSGPIQVKSKRRDTPVIIETNLFSDFAYDYRVDLPREGTYDLYFVCGPDEFADVKNIKGKRVVDIRITTVLPRQGVCYISSYERREPQAGTSL